jgi:AcrR family transcriptional regulator
MSRRANGAATQAAILAAARNAFTSSGYDGATIRSIARAAQVDPALVHHYYGTKGELFVSAMEVPFDPGVVLNQLLLAGTKDLGARLLRLFLSVWDDPEASSPILALLRSAVAQDASATMLRGFVTEMLIAPMARALDIDQVEFRATCLASQLFGLALARSVLRLEPLASMPPEEVVAAMAPMTQRYLLEPLSGAEQGATAAAPSEESGRRDPDISTAEHR